MPDDLTKLVQGLLVGNPAMRLVDTKDVLTALLHMRTAGGTQIATGPKNRYEVGDVVDGKFEVRGHLGSGGFSNVYRVYWALDDREYALKVFNHEVQYDKVQREIELLRSISHPHIVRAVWADQTRAGQWYLVSELIRGEPLTEYTDGKKRLSATEAIEAISQLLTALEAIHPNHARLAELQDKQEAGELSYEEFGEIQTLKTQGIVHRDIKPQNLMLTANGLVLLDFNIASRVGQPVLTISGTPPYQSPDVLIGTENWDVSPDLFAVGLVLYELLCCTHPYEHAQPRMDRVPHDPREFRPELSSDLAAFLLKSCAPSRVDRFATASEMRAVLLAIDPLLNPPVVNRTGELPPRLQALLAAAPPNVNPMVREFLALSSQARRTNRGTRGLDDLAQATYVPTNLDDKLSASLLAGQHQLVIITGNAGDGKTAFIQQVEAAARRAGAVVHSSGPNGSVLRYAGKEIVTLYDGSQDEIERTSDEVLSGFFASFAVGGTLDRRVRVAAINEGRLRDFLLAHRSEFQGFATDVIAVLDDPSAVIASAAAGQQGIVIVNLNLRSVTAGGENSIFSRQLRQIVEGPFWSPCEACAYREQCPIKYNVDTLRDPTSGGAVTERLRVLVDLIRLRRRRHLTMRDVRSLIAHLLFRDRICEEIPPLLAATEPLEIVDVTYFQGVGGLGSPPGSALERGAALLAEIDVALVSNPEDDRLLAAGADLRRMSFQARSGNYPGDLIAAARDRAGSGYDTNARLARLVHAAARRQTYFERSDDGWWEMLPYTRLREFAQALNPKDTGARERLRREVIAAISLYEGMPDATKAGEALWLSSHEGGDADLRGFRRFPLADFTLRIAQREAPYVETEPDRLELIYSRNNPALTLNRSDTSLILDLDLVEVLERLGEGYMPSVEEGRGFLVNLALFKNRLLAEPASELVLVADGRMLRIAVGPVRSRGSIELSEERA